MEIVSSMMAQFQQSLLILLYGSVLLRYGTQLMSSHFGPLVTGPPLRFGLMHEYYLGVSFVLRMFLFIRDCLSLRFVILLIKMVSGT